MKLSIVITAYNVSQYIKQCIDSVKDQKLDSSDELEIVVVEDKSTDSTLDILKEIEGINLIENSNNVGAGMSRRIGIENSTGHYVMLLDGDDYLENENHLATLLSKAKETKADVVGGGIKVLNEDNSYTITSYGNYTCEGYEKITKFWGERIVFMNNKIIRRTMYNKVPYCHRRYIEDTPVIIPILWYANKVEYVDTVGYVYRMRNDSLTHVSSKLKHTIFAGLCWCDLIEFFNREDPNAIKVSHLDTFIGNTFDYFNNNGINIQEIQLYLNEYCELMIRLVNIINFTAINFKQSNKTN